MYVVCSCVVGWVVEVVLVEVRGSCWLFEPAVHELAFHTIQFRNVFRCGKPSHAAREVVVVSVGSV